MKVITWNVNNRLGVVSQQVQLLGQHEPDVVALQDVNGNAVSQYIDAFRMIGLPHVLHTRDMLAAAEEYSFQVYRLDAVTWWPRLVTILPNDFRIQIDASLTPMITILNLSMVLTLWTIAASLILLITQHWLACMVVFLLGLFFARGCYSTAINQAVVYGRVVRVAFDLYRQEIFKHMHITIPDNLVGERVLWEVLTNCHYNYVMPWDSTVKIPELDYPFYYDTHYESMSPAKL